MKFKTILEGEQAVIFNHLGEGRLLVGPARVNTPQPPYKYISRARPVSMLAIQTLLF